MAAACAPWHCVRGPVRICSRGRPFNGIVSWQLMRHHLWIHLGLASVISTNAFGAGASACTTSESLAGECRDIRARVTYANGNPSIRIWPIGTTQLLGVRDSNPPLLPDHLSSRLAWDHAVYANLRVCPLTKERPGHMQVVCVASATNISVRGK